MSDGPTWGRKLKRQVDATLAKRDARWARMLAVYVSKQLDRLENALGYRIRERESAALGNRRRTASAVGVLLRQHPSLSAKDLSQLLGISEPTARRYAQLARDKFDIPAPARRSKESDNAIPTGLSQ